MARIQIPYAFRELHHPYRNKVFHGGRGGAKSHSFAEVLVDRGYERGRGEGSFRWLFAREIQGSLKDSVKKLLEDKIRKQGLGPKEEGGNGFYRITERTITGGDGRTEFLFAGLRTNPDSVKSMEGLDGAWVEEANKVSQRSIDLLTPTVRKPGSELWWSFNRGSVKDPVDNRFLGGTPPPRSLIRKVGWEDNPWFPEDLYEEMMWDKARDHDKWLHVWEGHPVSMSESRVFQNWTVDDIDDQVPAGCIPRMGADWGFANDPSVLVLVYIFGRTMYIRAERWKLKLEVDDTPAFWAGTDLREENARWENRHGFPGIGNPLEDDAPGIGHNGGPPLLPQTQVIADSARPEIISYMNKRDFNVKSSKKGAGSIVEGVEFLKSFDVVIHPSCKHVIDEWTYYSYKTDPLTDEVLAVLKDKKNHTVDSVRYAVESVRRHLKGRRSFQAPVAIPLKDG